VTIKAGTAPFSGVYLMPADGTPWDLSSYGHVEASLTNTGASKIQICVQVENEGDWHTGPWNMESVQLDPGQTAPAKVVFGLSYGFRPGFALDTHAVKRIYFFVAKADADVTFTVAGIQASGSPDEKNAALAAAPKPPPALIAVKPPQGVVFSPEVKVDPLSQFAAKGGAAGALSDDGKALQLDFPAGAQGVATFKPASGLWNLNEATEVRIKLRNTGSVPILPEARLESIKFGGPTDFVAAAAPLQPAEETEIVIPFAAKVPFQGVEDPDQTSALVHKSWGAQPGTGTTYRSNLTSGVTLRSDATPGAKRLQIVSIIADTPPLDLPAWLGQKPPVDGDWVQTLDEHFPGTSLDTHRWNIHTWGPMATDKRVHATKDDVIVKDSLTLRIEKKPGHINDDPAMGITEYATGYADTFGKWTQRYGYFEARVKLPTQPCVWNAFWLMPDRGAKFNNVGTHSFVGNRGFTEGSGMEFDIIESLSIWGGHSYNIAMHWDGYGATHKAIGTSGNYAQTDAEGFIVAGLLWTPGEVVYYANGKETARWKSSRISDVPSYIILDNVTGGWQTEPLDDSQLPSDYVVDYVRVWQRRDLASPDDGPKPNKGDLDAFHEDSVAAAPASAPQ